MSESYMEREKLRAYWNNASPDFMKGVEQLLDENLDLRMTIERGLFVGPTSVTQVRFTLKKNKPRDFELPDEGVVVALLSYNRDTPFCFVTPRESGFGPPLTSEEAIKELNTRVGQMLEQKRGNDARSRVQQGFNSRGLEA